jgi:hypothetical protein
MSSAQLSSNLSFADRRRRFLAGRVLTATKYLRHIVFIILTPTQPIMRPLLHLLITTVAAAAFADEPAKTESPWQKLFRQHAADYRFTLADERKVEVTKEPIMFWSQPVRGGNEGGVFLWTSQGQPVAIGTFFIWPLANGGQGVTHELHSLVPQAFVADWHGRAWEAPDAAIHWTALTDADPPAATPARRLLQAKRLAGKFSATSQGRDDRDWVLRLLPRPLYRYELPMNNKSDVLDGVVFGLVQGTDLEIVLLLEAVDGKTPSWRWAAARMSDLHLSLQLDRKQVWEVEKAKFDDSHAAYFCGTVEKHQGPPN